MVKSTTQYFTAIDMLMKSLVKFKYPTSMYPMNEDTFRDLSRLVWALQILVKGVIDNLEILGNIPELNNRLERVERFASCTKGILPIDDAAEFLGVSKKQIYYLVNNKDLPLYTPSPKMWLFKVEDIVDWALAHPKATKRPIDETGLVKTGS